MAAELTVRADLRFTVDLPGLDQVTADLVGEGRHLELRISRPLAFAGRGDAAQVRRVADLLAGLGLRLSVVHAGQVLVELGDTDAGWLQRRVTGSRHLRIAGMRGAVTGLRGRVRPTTPALPGRELAPPPTLFPLAPTFLRGPLRPVTTTHDAAHGGAPRLVVAITDAGPASGRVVHPLRARTTIGSDESCDIRLAGVAPLQAEVVHDDDDELVLLDLAHAGTTRVDGVPVERKALRSGNRVELGDWTLVYWRAEYADHGRPYGGRIGGELGHQRPQPGRHRAEPTGPGGRP